jgi:hypothetical protein
MATVLWQVKQGSLSLHMILHTGKKVACPLCAKLFQHKGKTLSKYSKYGVLRSITSREY